MSKLDNALLTLNTLVSDGMEYPEAEYTVSVAFKLTENQLQHVADDYLLGALFDGEKSLPAMLIKKGEYVKRKIDSKKVYVMGDFDSETGKFDIMDCDDSSRYMYVKGDAMLFVGFTY